VEVNAVYRFSGWLLLTGLIVAGCTGTNGTDGHSDTLKRHKARIIAYFRPSYPVAALARKESARLLLATDIDPTGVPTTCRIVSTTNHDFDQSALNWCWQLRYRPATLDGAPTSDPQHILHLNYAISRPAPDFDHP